MKKFLILITLAFFGLCFTNLQAQKPASTVTTKKFVPYKPPKLFTSVGVIKDSALAPVEQVKAIISQPLFVTDAGKNVYTVQSYQFLYKKRVVSEDASGKAIPATSIASQQFYDAKPIPDLWIKIMREDLKKGEEVFYFDIIVKDKLGRIMHAPDLKIITN